MCGTVNIWWALRPRLSPKVLKTFIYVRQCWLEDVIQQISFSQFRSFSFFGPTCITFSSRGNNVTALRDNHYARLCHFIFERVHSVFNLRSVHIWATSCEGDVATLPLFLHLLWLQWQLFIQRILSLQLVVFLMMAKLSPRTYSHLKWVFLYYNLF